MPTEAAGAGTRSWGPGSHEANAHSVKTNVQYKCVIGVRGAKGLPHTYIPNVRVVGVASSAYLRTHNPVDRQWTHVVPVNVDRQYDRQWSTVVDSGRQ